MPFRAQRTSPILLVTLFLIFGSSFMPAQKLPEIDGYGGFSHIRFNSSSLGFSGYPSLNGWAASITAPHLYEQLGLTVNASGDYGSQVKVYNFLLGPQFSFEKGHLRVFGNVLFGKAETKVAIHQPTQSEITSVGRAVAIGGGLEVNLSHDISVRPIDADYLFTKTFSSSQDYLRVSAGLVYRFGKK